MNHSFNLVSVIFNSALFFNLVLRSPVALHSAFWLHFLIIHTITFSRETLKVCELNLFQEI